jgi:menaquinone-dependent protoporphyrinogen oxidase
LDSTSPKPVSRRNFLKIGCLTTAAAGLATCAAGLAVSEPGQTPVELPPFSYGDNSMKGRILIAYASATGSTVEVAAEIGKTLGARGFSVDVRPVRENPQVDGYQAVLVGSAVQYGNWLPEAVEFVKDNLPALSRLPVALFCVHIRNLGDDEESRRNRLAYLDEVRALLEPVEEGYFAGRFDRRGAALLLPGLIARFIPPMDFRSWKKIRAWAENISQLLPQQA